MLEMIVSLALIHICLWLQSKGLMYRLVPYVWPVSQKTFISQKHKHWFSQNNFFELYFLEVQLYLLK